MRKNHALELQGQDKAMFGSVIETLQVPHGKWLFVVKLFGPSNSKEVLPAL
jgi:hypothetical protein